ncbi:hypothetical protein [Chryseolinea lacunae]|uniref:DoxX family protein n=1 Tax=Chryseolinea lacunae TaxID=2801331 RepID=A0ABS1KW46_9BACT|nr:hypothetical protein [Chryseolinea lacunae]MBL0743634.1 hypothetical protein [Chryseolinea lacunae]
MAIEIPTTWTPVRKLVFRFAFLYFLLYTFPAPVGMFVPWLNFLTTGFWDAVVVWTGHSVFHVDITVRPAGSGDTTWNYVQLFCIIIFSLLGTVVWSMADRRRADYSRLFTALTIWLRYYLAMHLVFYGTAKVFKTQFPFPIHEQLMTPMAMMSPMGLLWRFMGYSTLYNIFTGGCEVLGGLLLFFRRTTTLGALVSVGVMIHVWILNLSYDVPVKLFSGHLTLIAIFLLMPQLRRLTNFFVLNKPVAPEVIVPLFEGRKARWFMLAGKLIMIGFIAGFGVVGSINNRAEIDAFHAKAKARSESAVGTYEVIEQRTNGVAIPTENATARWKQISVATTDRATVHYMDGAEIQWRFAADSVRAKMSLVSFDYSTIYQFKYKTQAGNLYVLKGTMNGDSIHIQMRKNPGGKEQMPLTSRGFHWINEFPFNQ